MPAPERRLHDPALMDRLLRDVQVARADVVRCREAKNGVSGGQAYRWWCAELARAMRRYADAAEDCGVGLSYRFRDEMRLYQAIGRVPGR